MYVLPKDTKLQWGTLKAHAGSGGCESMQRTGQLCPAVAWATHPTHNYFLAAPPRQGQTVGWKILWTVPISSIYPPIPLSCYYNFCCCCYNFFNLGKMETERKSQEAWVWLKLDRIFFFFNGLFEIYFTYQNIYSFKEYDPVVFFSFFSIFTRL